VGADDDADDRGGPVRPELRAEDGFDLDDPLLTLALRSGVAVVHAGPGDANSIGGQAGVFLTSALTVADATVRAPSAVIVSLTEEAKATYGEAGRLPGTRMANVGLIRQALIDADRSATSPDAGRDVLARVLSDSLPAWVAARRSDEIATALRIAREFDIEIVVTGATEAASVADALQAAGVTVVVEPTDVAREALGESTALGAAMAMHMRGIPFALASGDARTGATLFGFARAAVRAGLPADAALAAITTAPAALLGIGARAGTLEAGRDAHIVLLDGDPFAATTNVRAIVVAGRPAWQADTGMTRGR
jgi:imidazolonepropionase-like amidohydrolase